jgi:hypothetical protein
MLRDRRLGGERGQGARDAWRKKSRGGGELACGGRLKKGEGILVRQGIAAVCSRLTMAF